MATRKCLHCDNVIAYPANVCPECKKTAGARKVERNRKWRAAKYGGDEPLPEDSSKHRARHSAVKEQRFRARMDAIVMAAYERASGYEAEIIRRNPLNKHLFQKEATA